MDRLNKKCFIASTGIHLLIGVVAFVGPAFTASSPKVVDELQILNFEPDILTDSDVSGGGSPNAGRQPDPAPPQPVPKPQPDPPQPKPPEPKTRPAPEPEPPKQKVDPNAFEDADKKKKPKPNLVLKPRPNPAVDAEKQAQERKRAEARRLANELFKEAGNAIKSGAANRATAIEEGSFGPGGGGPSYASYRAWVWTVFDRAWIAPDDVTVENAVAEVRVVIARDGSILKAEFTKRSGDSQVDASIQRALDRVKATGIGKPFPEGSTDKERRYIIPFDLSVKRGLA